MDIEFHYCMTYLIAAKGGFSPEDARVIAYASQYVDDNDMMFHIDKGQASAYENYISQTMNILKPKPKLMRIYPIFHFIPGNPEAQSGARRDGMMHWLNCTPNNENAQKLFNAALRSENLFRIGIATHAYADTWAHQNFTGSYSDFNASITKLALDIGHAQAGHQPDEPALVWTDNRLIENRVDNRARIIEAAKHILLGYLDLNSPDLPQVEIDQHVTELEQALDRAIGERDQDSTRQPDRIAQYYALAKKQMFGGTELPKYDADQWFDDAITENVKGLRDRTKGDCLFDFSRLDPCTDLYTWDNRDNYKESHWYRFQEEVKAHQREALVILKASNFAQLDMKKTLQI